MKNISKTAQKWICLIPLISTTIIVVLTYINFSMHKASVKKWFQFVATVVIALFVSALIDKYLLSGLFPVFNWIVDVLIWTVVNFILIDLQVDNSNNKTTIALSKKQIILITISLCILIAVLFCAICIPKFIEIFKFESEIPDTNGPDNYSLATLTEDDVLSDYGSRMLMSSHSKKGSETSVKGVYQDDDKDEVCVSAKIFDGVYTAQATKINTDKLMFNISSVVESGNFAIYILIDGEIYCQADINCETQVKLENIKDKLVLIKIVGEAANFEFCVTRSTII